MKSHRVNCLEHICMASRHYKSKSTKQKHFPDYRTGRNYSLIHIIISSSYIWSLYTVRNTRSCLPLDSAGLFLYPCLSGPCTHSHTHTHIDLHASGYAGVLSCNGFYSLNLNKHIRMSETHTLYTHTHTYTKHKHTWTNTHTHNALMRLCVAEFINQKLNSLLLLYPK